MPANSDASGEQLIWLASTIGEWSQKNFGNQAGDGLLLGRIAPVLGIVEEVGELLEGTDTGNLQDIRDAIADTGIYLLDYISRSAQNYVELNGLLDTFLEDMTEENATSSDDDNLDTLVRALGHLCHVELKRVQGIRGYSEDDKYSQERLIAVRSIVYWFRRLCKRMGINWIAEISRTYKDVIQYRNWRTSSLDGRA